MKKLHFFLCALFLATTFLFTSCEDDPDEPTPSPPVLNGLFIVNEGAFGSGNGSITYRSTDSAYYNADIYKAVNNEPLGDVVQSMSVYDRRGYICVNNSQKLVIVDMTNFKKVGTVSVGSPRYFVGFNGRGYISDWTTNSVKIIDIPSNTPVMTIPCGKGPEGMLGYYKSMYVCNSGGFDIDSTVTVFNVNTHLITDTIVMGVNPNSIVMDKNNKIWVLCQGTLGPDYTAETADDIGGQLVQIDPANNNAILQVFQFGQFDHPLKLQKNQAGDVLYFMNGSSYISGSLWKMNITDAALPAQPLINEQFYGFGVDHFTEELYTGLPVFSVSSYVKRYNTNGTLKDSIQAGIAPNGFVFYH